VTTSTLSPLTPPGEVAAVWCRYCRYWHLHGDGAGHRVAICFSVAGSLYNETGYILRPVGKPIPRYKKGKPKPPDEE